MPVDDAENAANHSDEIHEEQSRVLEDLSDAVRYRAWLVALTGPHLGDNPIEVGSGTGDYVAEWLESVPRFEATEPEGVRLEELRRRFEHDPRVRVSELDVPSERTADHTASVALNVLEHIPDHVGAMRSMSRLSGQTGRIVVIVPAFEVAMSRFDRSIGHLRRYTKRSASAAAQEAGLEVELCRYVNPVGLIAWIVVCRMLGRSPSNGPVLRVYDRLVVPVLRFADRFIPAPFGQSVLLVARTPTG